MSYLSNDHARNRDLIVGANDADFVRGKRWFTQRADAEPLNAEALLVDSISALNGAVALGARERDRRIGLLVSAVSLSDTQLGSLVATVTGTMPRAFNAVMSSISPDRRKAFRGVPRPSSSATSAPPPASEVALFNDNSSYQAIIATVSPTKAVAAERDHIDDFRSVVLLGSEEEHARNTEYLKQANFLPLRCESTDQLRQMVPSICGVVVGGLWWNSVSPNFHRDEFCKILEMSSMFFVRVGINKLNDHVASCIAEIQRELYGAERDSATFGHGFDCSVTAADLSELSRIADFMSAAERIRFHPHGITSREGVLLRALATKRVRGRNGDASMSIHTLQAGLLTGGFSGAKIVMISPDDGGAPFVVKLFPVERLRLELRRYQQWIKSWDDCVQPELVTHLDQSALVYRMVDSAGDPGEPAPTLEMRLNALRRSEVWDQMPAAAEDDLVIMLKRTVAKLAALNKKKIPDGTPPQDPFWLAWSAENFLKNSGASWDLSDPEGNSIDFAELLCRSIERINRLHGCARIHGDIHLRNVLVNDDRQPMLIDFDRSGPGHPCYDIVCLDVAVCTFAFRALTQERNIVLMMRAIHFEGASYEQLVADFPKLACTSGNRLSMRTAIAAREACLDVLSNYEGDVDDYLAMRVVVNSHVLSLISPQSSVLRAAISACPSC